jgi:Zn-finger nucleic acid-binding protein
MNCPICNVTLLLAEKQGVEIDYCPQCRGIWLDRGELEKIIEKSGQSVMNNDIDDRNRRPYSGYDDDHHSSHDRNSKRKKGFLGDLFDF